jgi:hypothetical protein
MVPLDPRQAMVAGLDQWRRFIVGCDNAEVLGQVRDIESVSRMLYSVMLETVAELDSRNIAGTAGFRNTSHLLAGMLNLSLTEAGTRVAHAGQLGPRRALGGEVLAPLLPNTAAALPAGEIGPGAPDRRPGAGRAHLQWRRWSGRLGPGWQGVTSLVSRDECAIGARCNNE